MWEMKKLGEVCKTGAGGTPRKSKREYYDGGTIPWLLSGEVAQGNILESKNFITEEGLAGSSAKLFPPNTVLIAMYGATAGQVGILRFEAATNQAVCGILPNDNFLPEYLYYVFLLKRDELIAKAAGNAQPNISQIKIKNTVIPTPSLPEQIGIVAILDDAFAGIDAAIANTEKNLANARELFESYLNNVFTQKGDGWVETTIGEEIELLTGYAFKSKEYTNSANGVPLLRGDNILQGYFRWENVKRWPEERLGEFKKFLLAEGDVVLAMDRTWVKAGMKYAKITENLLPCLLLQRVARLRSKDELDADFLFHLMGSKLFTDYVLSIQTGLGVPHISGKQIKSFQFAKPNVADQKSVIEAFNAMAKEIQNLETIYQQKLNALAELKQSILQKAFNGELTAQDAAA